MKAQTMLSLIVTGMLLSGYQAYGAQGTGRAIMKVVTAVAVTNVSDLVFTEAAAGSAAETVDADNAETVQNASFDITGEPNKAIMVTLPTDGTVKMVTAGGGSADTEIAVDTFTSNAPTTIDASGTTPLYVGATRATLSGTQTAGDYEGDFTVDVVYQ
ncbi:hypothetical protein D3C72_1697340 [compost metagenome]